eukprot:m.659978 g.659978  ORF g.659978 m.659978 type:complete len:200 (-) comp22728_c0_seq13:26-625(-)
MSTTPPPTPIQGRLFYNNQMFHELNADSALFATGGKSIQQFYGISDTISLFSFTDKGKKDRRVVAVSDAAFRSIADLLSNECLQISTKSVTESWYTTSYSKPVPKPISKLLMLKIAWIQTLVCTTQVSPSLKHWLQAYSANVEQKTCKAVQLTTFGVRVFKIMTSVRTTAHSSTSSRAQPLGITLRSRKGRMMLLECKE